FILVVWLAAEWMNGQVPTKAQRAGIAAAILVVLTLTTWHQIRYWHDGVTLFQRAVDVTDNNYVAQNNLGEALAQQSKLDEATAHFMAALEINPQFAAAEQNIGMALVQQGKLDDAINRFSR